MLLERFGELLALAREHLDAVVLEWIVRCGDHDARRVLHSRREVRDRWRRDDSRARQRSALTPDAGGQLALDPAARLAGIPTRQKPRALLPMAERARERCPEAADRWRIERVCPG